LALLFADRRLELRQVDLAQRALVEAGVDADPRAHDGAADRGARRLVADPLLVVDRVVLDVADDALALDAARPPDRHPPREVRVLAEVLERAAVERRAEHVHRGRVDDVVALLLDLVADQRAVAEGVVEREGGRERHRGRERGGLALAGADRAVAEVHGRQADAVDAVERPGVRALAPDDAGVLVALE
jgi:hypothetical protein